MKNQSHALKRLLENLHERHSLLLVHGNHVETSHLMLPLVRDIDWIRLIHTEHSKGGLDREVVQAYGPEFANDWFVRKLRRQYEELLQQAARFTFPSYGAMSLFEEHKHSIPLNTCARVSVIYSGVDVAPLPIPPPKHGEMQASLFAIAKHVPEKGIDRMIRAIRTLKSEQINVSLRIAGAYTSLSSELYRLREDCALNPRDIEFLGPLSSARILEELSRADLFLACPHVVVFDLSLLEAMAAGKAIVTTRLAGNVEALGEHYEGLFDSDDELPSVIARLLREEPLRAQMGIANRKRYEEEFTLSRMATRYIQLYESVAEESIVPSMRCKP